MRAKDYNVLVCVPSTGTWMAETAKCVALMFSHFSLYKVKGAASQRISLLSIQASMLSTSREMAVRKALTGGYTHLMFVDSDMIIPVDTAKRFLERRKPFIAANCTTRKFPVEQVGHTMEGERLDSRGRTGLEEVQHVGLAVSMVDVEVLKRLRPPLFLMDWIPQLATYCGEDVYFCQKLLEVGETIYIDHDVSQKVLHIGKYNYGHKDVGTEVTKLGSEGNNGN